MKICIATFYAAHNYGAVLQAYALSCYLSKKHNASVSFLNYKPPSTKQAYKIFVPIRSINDIKHNVQSLIKYHSLKTRRFGFNAFIIKYFRESIEYSSIAEIIQNPPEAELFITGSDQVFRYKNEASDAYYLSFCQQIGKPSLAYAASFGTGNIDMKFKERVSNLLSGIGYLSSRESEGAALIKQLIGKDVPVVLDPVFLLTMQEWKLLSSPPHIAEKYILVYALVGYQEQLAIAQQISLLTKFPIYMIHATQVRDKAVSQTFTHASPEEFVGLFSSAACVVTDSFHGTAFSLVFEKDFYCHIAIEAASSRIRNLLENLDLGARIVSNPKLIDLSNMKINYTLVSPIIRLRIKESTQFVSEALACLDKDE
ncbi:MAG: polysaccharide pyruvyl transferase family protein [Candidatus Cloacimonas sp.]|jgi:polysaccharide pyruvyl transferase WcaK-like protein|nr:polysaccharide pyruvyl transferase family protein [Candidatus Cloacimonas sp.]